MAGNSWTTKKDGGRGDTNERQVPLLADDLSDDSFEYDDEAIMRMTLSTPCHAGDLPRIGIFPPITPFPDDSTWRTRPTVPTVQERTDEILREVRARVARVSDDIKDLRQQTSKLSADFQAQDKKLNDMMPLKRSYTTKIKNQIQQLEELNYLNGLIAYLKMVDKEMVLLPCRYDARGEIFPRESSSDVVNDSLSLVELGESYKEFSSDESATGL